MKFNFTEKDMAEFESEHPQAYAFLVERSLMNEYDHLETNYIVLNEWEQNRLSELRTWYANRVLSAMDNR